MVEPHSSNFRVITTNCLGVRIFRKFTITKVTLFSITLLIVNKLWRYCRNEPPRDKAKKMACAPSEDSDQTGHPPSLIIVFAVRMKKAWVLSYPLSAQRRLWSDWADAQADLSLRWAHMPFCWFCHKAAQILFHIVREDHNPPSVP